MTPIIFSLLFGFFCLWKGGDWLIDGASAIGKRLGISPIILGLTLIAFGTSAPELVVSLIASFQGNPDIIVGNVVGSNMANTCLILGITGLIFPIILTKQAIKTELFINLAVTAVLLLFVAVITPLHVTFVAALILSGLFLLFLKLLVTKEHPLENAALVVTHEPEVTNSISQSIIWFALGCTLLPLGGHLVVKSAISAAALLAISQATVSLLVVAIGTSLPELFTCIAAARKKESELALGNIIGSNIFNFSLILSISAFIKTVPFQSDLLVDLALLVGLSITLLSVLIFKPQHRLSRFQSLALVIVYIMYVVMVVGRG